MFVAGPLFKTGTYTFFLGVILQYSETYNRCAYIRFARETLMNPASVLRRARRVLRYAQVSKEIYYMAKETYSYGKRGLLTFAYLRCASTLVGLFS